MADKKRRPPIPEHLLAQLWRNRAWRQTRRTTDGRRLLVLYPGRPNGGPGPDFKDAVVQIEGSLPVRGDLEVHRRSRGWREHGHQRDTKYNKVVLHVVLGATAGAAACRQDGGIVPVAAMNGGPLLPAVSGDRACEGAIAERLQEWRNLPPERLEHLLDQAGRRRFLAKSAILQRAMGMDGAEEVLYQGIMEALGYSRNRAPFKELARLLPWGILMELLRNVPAGQREAGLRRCLVSASGLSEKVPRDIDEGPSIRLPEVGFAKPMDPSAWCRAGVRPSNHPLRRIQGAASMLVRHADAGLLAGLAPLAGEDNLTPLLRSLMVVEEGRALIGRGRALDMAVNVVLPGLHAWGTRQRNRALAASCLHLYVKAPPLAANDVTREAAVLLGLREGWIRWGALRQQGLMHLYRVLLEEW